MTYTFIFFAGLVITLFLTPPLITFLKKSDIVDKPGARRVNTKVVPRMGGIVIFTSVMILIFSFYQDINSIRLLFVGALIILLCGTLDDIIGLTALVKLAFQILSSVLVVTYLSGFVNEISIFGLYIPQPFDLILLGFFIVGVINSINLLDGLDGLASGFSLLIFVVFFLVAIYSNNELVLIITSSMSGSILGFLKYNAYPAKIFLGDTGSLILGFFIMVVALLISVDHYGAHLDLTYATIVLGVPIIDTLKVMTLRILRRESPFNPDKTHLHHIILESNIQHKFSVFIVHSFTVIFIILSLAYYKGYEYWSTFLFFVVALFLVFSKLIFSKVSIISELFAKYYNYKVSKFPQKVIEMYKKFIIPVSIFSTAIILTSSIPLKTTLTFDELLFLTIIGILTLILSVMHYQRTKEIAGIYVLLNTAGFFFLSGLSESIKSKYLLTNLIGEYYPEIFFGIILLTVIVYIVLRERIFENKEALLTGIDLILILFFSLLFVINNFIGYEKLSFLNIVFYQSFIIYLLYKIVSRFRQNIAKYILIFSFLLPFISITVLLVTK